MAYATAQLMPRYVRHCVAFGASASGSSVDGWSADACARARGTVCGTTCAQGAGVDGSLVSFLYSTNVSTGSFTSACHVLLTFSLRRSAQTSTTCSISMRCGDLCLSRPLPSLTACCRTFVSLRSTQAPLRASSVCRLQRWLMLLPLPSTMVSASYRARAP
jgi:hypothetical protein